MIRGLPTINRQTVSGAGALVLPFDVPHKGHAVRLTLYQTTGPDANLTISLSLSDDPDDPAGCLATYTYEAGNNGIFIVTDDLRPYVTGTPYGAKIYAHITPPDSDERAFVGVLGTITPSRSYTEGVPSFQSQTTPFAIRDVGGDNFVHLYRFVVPPAGWVRTVAVTQTAGDLNGFVYYLCDFEASALPDDQLLLLRTGILTVESAAGQTTVLSTAMAYANSYPAYAPGVISVLVVAAEDAEFAVGLTVQGATGR